MAGVLGIRLERHDLPAALLSYQLTSSISLGRHSFVKNGSRALRGAGLCSSPCRAWSESSRCRRLLRGVRLHSSNGFLRRNVRAWIAFAATGLHFFGEVRG
jgi:hypothetical protein